MKYSLLAIIFPLLILGPFAATQAQPKTRELLKQEQTTLSNKRTALVIGNSNYQFARPLANPINDAVDIATVLKDLGFDVIVGTDLSLKQMVDKVREFGDKLKSNGGVGLVYYAGHGIQVNGRNYLIPTDANIPREDEIAYNALELNQVFSKLQSANNGFNIVILDACRNNPFARSWSRGIEEGGLAQVSAPTGTFIAYATDVNATADDGTGRNGIYTGELLKVLNRPNLKIEETFKEIQKAVRTATNGRQVPWISSSFSGDFYFRSQPIATPATNSSAAQPATVESDAIYKLGALAQAKFDKGDFDGAIADLRSAIEIDPSHQANYKAGLARAYFQRGFLKYQQANFQGAEQDFTNSIEVSPVLNAQAYNSRGVARIELKRDVDALADYDRAIELDPKFAVAYANRATLLRRLNRKTESDRDYAKARELDPTVYTPGSKPEKNPEIVRQVDNLVAGASTSMIAGDFDEAIRQLTQAINLMPKNSSLYILRGQAKALKGYLGGILVDLPTAVNLGARKLDDSTFNRMLSDVSKAIEQNPKDAKAILMRGMLYESHGDCGKADKDMKLAAEVDPTSYTAQFFKMTNEMTGDAFGKKDLTRINDLIAINPNAPLGYFMRAVAYQQLGKKKEYEADMKTLISLSEESNVVIVLTKLMSSPDMMARIDMLDMIGGCQ